jgi:cell division protein FtsI/penicillin-binding protein 2
MKLRIILFSILLSTLFLVVICRLAYIQLFEDEKMHQIALHTQLSSKIIEAERGRILDRNGKELAISVKVKSIYARPREVKSKETVAARLSTILGINEKVLIQKLRKELPFVWIKRKVLLQDSQLKDLSLPGIGFTEEYKRVYPKGTLAGHLLGFVGMDDHGLEGVELYFDEALRGKKREFKVLQDAVGRMILGEEALEPVGGGDLILTIDEVIQHIAEEELHSVCKEFEAKGGGVIVMDPRSGEILAAAIEPPFNPNFFQNGSPERWRNRLITDCLEPGSTFKIITAACALLEGKVELDEKFRCNGSIEVAGHKIHCYKKHGELTLSGIIAESCNVGMIKIASRIESPTFYKYIRSFGFGTRTGVNLPGEGKGILRKVKEWSNLSHSALAIGQEIGVTPLQLITAAIPIANDGVLLKPLIAKAIRKEKRILKEYGRREIRRVLSPESSKILRKLLEDAVREGTGVKAQIRGYRVAGKTGTAQKIEPSTGKYSKEKYISSFLGFVPADSPALLILIIVNEPKGCIFGGEVAAPTFKRIAQKVLPYLGIYPNFQLSPRKSEEVVRKRAPSFVMPDLKGVSMREAWSILSPITSNLRFVGSGFAVEQKPELGITLTPEREVVVWFEGK